MSHSLRPYQEQALCNIEDDLKNGTDKLLLVLATGLGKTKVAVDLTERLNAKRVLFIADTEELIEQSALAFIENKFDEEMAGHVEGIGFINWVNGAKCHFENHSNTFRMGVIKADTFKIDAEVIVASAQTLYRRLDKIPEDYFDIVIVDECFPKGTLVDGINIENIKVGDVVTSFNHDSHKTEKKKVVRLFKKEVASDLYKIILTNGTEFICTEEHPIYTKEFGYKSASFINKCFRDKDVSLLYLSENKYYEKNKNKTIHQYIAKSMSDLQKALHTKTRISKISELLLSNMFRNNKRNNWRKHKDLLSIMFFLRKNICNKILSTKNKAQYLLLKRLQKKRTKINMENSYSNMSCLRRKRRSIWEKGTSKRKGWKKFCLHFKNLHKKIICSWSRKSKNNKEKKWSSFNALGTNEDKKSNVDAGSKRENDRKVKRQNIFVSWRKWGINQTSNYATFSHWLRYGICNTYDRCKRNVSKFTNLLQSRFSSTRTETCNRSGWKDSQVKEVEVFRQKKNRDFEFVRVASCEIYKRRDRSECGKSYEKTYVYNIEVEDNHNYFVENTLVHNCHKYMSKTYIMPLNYFKPRLMVGLTASPYRMDGLSLGNLFDKITFEYNIGDGIKNNYLCQLDGIRIKTDVSLDNVKTTAGELNTKDLATEVNIPKRNRLVVDSYIKHATGKQGIFFCVDVQHAVDLAEMFNEYGISCKPVVGDEKVTPERKRTISEFKQGKIQVLTNVMVLTTGFNHPEVGCIGNVAPTKSLVKFVQSVGRGTRLKSKEYVDKFGQTCTILDFVDSTSRHKLINCWELDRVLNLEDRVFTTEAKKQLILEERQRRIAHVENLHKKDEKIVLIELPPAKQFAWKKMQEPATAPQLKWVADLGYDIQNVQYTKQQCADIIGMEVCSKREKDYLESKGYDAKFATKSQYNTVYYELEMKSKYSKR